MFRVGLVIPVRNRPSLALEALESVRNQSRGPDEVIIVDDGSTDHTADRVEAWYARHNLPSWQLILFLDSDDLWPSDFVRHAVTELTAQPHWDRGVRNALREGGSIPLPAWQIPGRYRRDAARLPRVRRGDWTHA